MAKEIEVVTKEPTTTEAEETQIIKKKQKFINQSAGRRFSAQQRSSRNRGYCRR